MHDRMMLIEALQGNLNMLDSQNVTVRRLLGSCSLGNEAVQVQTLEEGV